MKILVKYLLITLLSVFILTSCSEKKQSKTAQLKGTWNLEYFAPLYENHLTNDSIIYTLGLNISDTTQKFSSNIFAPNATVKGSWKIKGDSICFDYITPNIQLDPNQTTIINDSTGKTSLQFKQNDIIVGQMNSDGMKFIQETHYAKIISFEGDQLEFLLEDKGTFKMKRYIKEVPSASFTSILRGILGMAFLLSIAWLFSTNRKSIDWQLVWKGVLFQLVIALLVLKAPFVEEGFTFISKGFVTLIGYTNDGVDFLFGQMGIGEVQAPLITFAIKVLPTIIFFSALMSLFYYWGILQKVVYVFAWVMKKFMRLSGAESLAAAGNVFLGQTESPLLVKPYLLGMTKSEIMCLMTGGMATIAGGVLAAYIGFLGGDDPEAQAFFAKHLLTASIISAPAAVVAAKMLVPETEKINENLSISKDKMGVNALEAITNGTSDGLKLAVNVGAMLLVFIAMMALANGVLGWFGNIGGLNNWIASNTNYDGLSFQFLFGYACAPIVWMMGVENADIVYVGELLGQKTILNEFVAYPRLGEMKDQNLISEKSIIMSTYMLCGFANIASIGIQIGGIGALIPSRKGLLSQLGVRALIGGTLACLMTAVIVGMTM